MRKIYECSECGITTTSWNEGQCPNCLTLDSLYPVGDRDYIENSMETDPNSYDFKMFE